MSERLPPPDPISRAAEYLREFTRQNPAEFKTFEDLSARASAVGEDLYQLLAEYGEVLPPFLPFLVDPELETLPLMTVLRRDLADGSITLSGRSSGVYLEKWDQLPEPPPASESPQAELASLFSGARPNIEFFLPANKELFQASSIELYGRINRGSQPVVLYPRNHPETAEVHQQFVRALIEVVADILTVLGFSH